MRTDVQQVEDWYNQNYQRLSHQWQSLEFLSYAPDHAVNGNGVIQIKDPKLVGQITFWNKGDVEVIGLPTGAKEPLILDDRMRNDSDEIPTLLDHYFTQLDELATRH